MEAMEAEDLEKLWFGEEDFSLSDSPLSSLANFDFEPAIAEVTASKQPGAVMQSIESAHESKPAQNGTGVVKAFRALVNGRVADDNGSPDQVESNGAVVEDSENDDYELEQEELEDDDHDEDEETGGISSIKHRERSDGGELRTRKPFTKGKDYKIQSMGSLQVLIDPLPTHLHHEYRKPPATDYVARVLAQVPSLPGEKWYTIELDDGRLDQVSYDELFNIDNGALALRHFESPEVFGDEGVAMDFGGRAKKKPKLNHDPDYDNLEDGNVEEQDPDVEMVDEDDEVYLRAGPTRRHRPRLVASRVLPSAQSTRRSTRYSGSRHVSSDIANQSEAESKPRQLRTRPSRADQGSKNGRITDGSSRNNDVDELAADSDDEDVFPIVHSDLLPSRGKGKRKRGRPGRLSYREASIEFEIRRSGRSTKVTKSMYDPGLQEDESFLVEDDRPVDAPKVISIKEVFKPLEDSGFKAAHSPTCDTCGGSGNLANKGILIHCQGCSLSYHKVCIGYRAGRDHRVTKIGTDSFVLQCRYCIGVYKKTATAPSHDACQTCHGKGPTCKEFSPKLTARGEEKLRMANDGVDPITKVSPSLVNGAENVLFRCAQCKRGFHYEHLPRLVGSSARGTKDTSAVEVDDDQSKDDIRADRLAEYSIDWKCKDCLNMTEKIQTLVTWRPFDRDKWDESKTFEDFTEDEKEYLVKWDSKSHAHCVWKPGAWVWGVANGTMRTSFSKRNDGVPPQPIFSKNEAIPAEYLLAEIILAVRYHGNDRGRGGSTKEESRAEINRVSEVRVKFQGLSYEDVVWDVAPPKSNRLLWNAFKDAYEEYLNGKYFVSVSSNVIADRIKKFRAEEYEEIVKQPEGLAKGRQLMPYQIQGVNWLVFNFYKKTNVVLADEMGLGKTIQVCAFMAALALDRPKCWPFLVVVPNATCPNWRREIKQWVPDLRVVTYHGGRVAQSLAYKNELFPEGTKEMKAHIVVMSYDSAQDDYTRQLFKTVQWRGLVVDEGQRLKNDQNLLYGALRAMKIPFRLLLTGTPLQNNKRELFNLIQFIDSNKNAAKLDEEYAVLDKDNIPKLHSLIKPYFLRRTKADVLKFLPPMGQIIVPVTMSVVQEKLCKSIMAKNPQLIRAIFANTKMNKLERGSLNNILMQLRKCLCHPFIYSESIEEREVDAETVHRNLVQASSKLLLLDMMLPKLKERGHRVLIFTQFLKQLDILEDFLNGLGLQYRRLDGGMGSLEKQKRIDEFNAPNSELFAFLLSTRAGGVGINLATADTVIILDPDFNPHQDLQALSRAHRIGQNKKVLCLQFMTKGTVEEKIMQIGRKKMALDHVLIETMDDEDLAANDLESVLKHGAEALFKDDNEKETIKYDSASVDKLLDRSHLVKPESSKDESEDKGEKGERQFTLARVWAVDKGSLTDDLEIQESKDDAVNLSVWENILRQREEEARRKALLEQEVLGRGGRRRQNVKYSHDQDVEGALANSDESEQDGDFVNNEAKSSDGDGSDEEEEMPNEGMDDGSRTRTKPGKKSQGTTPKKMTATAKLRMTPKKTPPPRPKTPSKASNRASRASSKAASRTPSAASMSASPTSRGAVGKKTVTATPTSGRMTDTPPSQTPVNPNSSQRKPSTPPTAYRKPRVSPANPALPVQKAHQVQQPSQANQAQRANQSPPQLSQYHKESGTAPAMPPAAGVTPGLSKDQGYKLTSLGASPPSHSNSDTPSKTPIPKPKLNLSIAVSDLHWRANPNSSQYTESDNQEPVEFHQELQGGSDKPASPSSTSPITQASEATSNTLNNPQILFPLAPAL